MYCFGSACALSESQGLQSNWRNCMAKVAIVTSPQAIMALEDITEQSRYLPDDIIDDILIRLPVKDLLRYKCVCTRWCSLISSPPFVSSHLECTISDPSRHIILVQYHDKSIEYIFPNLTDREAYLLNRGEIIVVGSINGLVCLVDEDNNSDIWIRNPATKKEKKLPVGSYNAYPVVTFGFGWDPKANVYKLAKFVHRDGRSFGEVWRSDSDSWRGIEVCSEFFHPVDAMTSSSDVTVKGGSVSYWIVSDRFDYEVAEDTFYDFELAVASFDMSTELLEINMFPELDVSYDQLVNDFSNRNGVCGVNWRENFALVERHTSGTQETYYGWTFDSTEECWTVVFSISLDALPLGCLDSFGEKLVLVVAHRLVLTDVKTGATHELGREEDYVYQARFFLESVVSLEGFVSRLQE